MIMAILYMGFFFFCIFLVILAVVLIVTWKWKAFFSILLVAVTVICVYWLPIVFNQWKFSELYQREKWKIIYSPDCAPNPLAELRFLRIDKIIFAEKNRSFRNPSLSKDGLRIACSISGGPDGENSGMGVMNSDGKGFQRLSLSGLKPEGIAWSPDGQKIAFWAGRDTNTQSMDLYLFDINKNKARLLLRKATFYGTFYTLSWAPDSQKLVFASLDGYVSIMDINSLKITKVMKGDAPSWSPDGTTIIYREGIPYSRKPDERLTYYAIKPNGEHRRFIFDGGPERWDAGYVTQPVVWSPDGKYILFFKTYDPLFNTNFSKIYVMDIMKNKKYFLKKKKHVQACSWGKLQ